MAGMLVLSRKVGESIIIDGHIIVTILAIRGNSVQIGVVAPPEVSVHRKEVQERIWAELSAAGGA